MAYCNNTYPGASPAAGVFGSAGPRAAIMAPRILDSCSAKECVEDMQLLFTQADQAIIATSRFAKGVFAEVVDVSFDIAAFVTGKNCYSVDVTYTCAVGILAYPASDGEAVPLTGYCCFRRRVLLKGEESGVRTFGSTGISTLGTPSASAQVAEPVLLNICLTDVSGCDPCPLPCGQTVCDPGEDLVRPQAGENTVYCTLGMFSIISLEQMTQLVVPVYDYAMPRRECAPVSNDPCELFESIEFPVRKFFPGKSGLR